LNKKIIYDLTPFSHLDYPNQLACIIWLVGCNMRCDYCYNKDIVFSKNGTKSLNDILLFLKKRVRLLDGIVLSGGEATSHNLIEFCQEVKKLGFKIKLDTNGTNFDHIKELIDLNLIDYIALDYKAPQYKYKQITHNNNFKSFENTLIYLIQTNIQFEVRTTIHKDLLDEEDINFIIDDLKEKGYTNSYFLQEFLETESNIGGILESSKSFNRELISQDLNVIYR
jgi:pyruvate formate lyase activating enzyme